MTFGVCTVVENAPAVKAAGWDFVEERVDLLIQGLAADDQWNGAARVKGAVLPIPAANVLVPPVLKIVGPDASIDKLRAYMTTVMSRAAGIGVKTLVFGSGRARNVPDGFDRNAARGQILDFLKMAAGLAKEKDITLVIEHLNHGECNIINSVEEAMTYVRAMDHPNVKCLLDTYHFWLNDEKLETLAPAMPWIRHVHVSDKNRTAPGTSARNDYRPIFKVLKQHGYDGPISVEAIDFDVAKDGATALAFVKQQWSEA